MIHVVCKCGKKMTANEDLAGQKINCFSCGRLISIPLPPREELAAPLEKTSEEATKEATATAPHAVSAREYVYWVLALSILPLAIDLGQPDSESFKDRFNHTLRSAPPEVQKRVQEMWDSGRASLDDILNALPQHRLEGAFLPRNTWYHWLFALAAAAVFWLIIANCFTPGVAAPRHLLFVGLFTSTFGIILLLTAHEFPPVRIFIDVCLISAHKTTSDFFITLAGYTLGVGFFEETVKLLPLIWYYRRHRKITWRMACLWGFASGVGFGVAEGVLYSEQVYNGIYSMSAYLVRFASCVGLHAVWAASAGITFYHCQHILQELLRIQDRAQASGSGHPTADLGRWLQWILISVRVVLIVMVLHGLYDAALTRDMHLLALVTAVGSLGWLAWQIEAARRQELVPAAAASA